MRATSELPATVTPAGQRLLEQLQQALSGGRACRSGAGSCKAIMETVYCSFSKVHTAPLPVCEWRLQRWPAEFHILGA